MPVTAIFSWLLLVFGIECRAACFAVGNFGFEPVMLARGRDRQEDEWFVANGGMSVMTDHPEGQDAHVNLFAQRETDWILPRITGFG
jgi:hypothetical protein